MSDLVSLAKKRALTGDLGVRRQIVGLHVSIEAQKLVAARVSSAVANGKLAHGYGSLLKLGDDIVTKRGAEISLALAGAAGVTWDAGAAEKEKWARQFLNSRSLSIAGGTDEIQRNNVSERVLGLPREPAFDRDVPFNQVLHN
jgi:alkylation response protein AidB-like acyl-CoA dehydrogenase